jgi:two-component system, sensor histidine kinase and response regulator
MSRLILVVEDQQDNRQIIRDLLSALDYQLAEAVNGVEALAAVAKQKPDLILMDIQMPVMDGYEATTELRKREGFAKHTPVIAMTAGALAENRDRCIAAGMDDFIPKPISQDAVSTVLDRWVPQTGKAALAATDGEADQQAPPATLSATSSVAAPSTTTSAPAPAVPPSDEHVQPACASIRQRMEELRSGDADADREAFTRIATMFITKEEADIQELAVAIDERDADQVRQHAHRIKGASGSIGATAMSRLSAEIESLGRQGRLDSAPELLDRLRFEFGQARDALESILNSPPSQTTN